MLEQRMKGCLISVAYFTMMVIVVLTLRIVLWLMPTVLGCIIVSAIAGGIFAGIIAGKIYRFTMKRYKVMAPESPYEYTKMAELKLTKDEVVFEKTELNL